MSSDLIQMMQAKGYADTVERIISALNRFHMTPDFEAIYTIVEGLTNLPKAIQESGAFTAFVCKDLLEIQPLHDSVRADLEGMLLLFNDFIYNECKMKRESITEIESVYDRLLNILNKQQEERVLEENREAGRKLAYQVGIGDTIVTTNYDMIVESYHRIKRRNYADGFRMVKGDPTIKEMDLTTYLKENERWLIKLHGSIYEYKYENNIFKTIEDPEKSDIPVRIQEKMVIYPTKEKPILKYPYYDFYEVFRGQKWIKLVAVGYSFRDDPVNNAILANLEKVDRSILIVVNPNPKEVIQNLGTLALSQFDDRIIPIQGKLVDEEVFQDLEDAVKTASKKRFYERKQERLGEKMHSTS